MEKSVAWNSKFGRVVIFAVHLGYEENGPKFEHEHSMVIHNGEGDLCLRLCVHKYIKNHLDIECAYQNMFGILDTTTEDAMSKHIAIEIYHSLQYVDGQWRATVEIYDGNIVYLYLHADFLIENK